MFIAWWWYGVSVVCGVVWCCVVLLMADLIADPGFLIVVSIGIFCFGSQSYCATVY